MSLFGNGLHWKTSRIAVTMPGTLRVAAPYGTARGTLKKQRERDGRMEGTMGTIGVVCAAARQKKSGSDSDPHESKLEALENREAALWDRQMAMSSQLAKDSHSMYERLQDSYESLKDYHARERDGWLSREKALVKENEELRNKLMFVMTRMTDMSSQLMARSSSADGDGIVRREGDDETWIDATAASGGIPERSSSVDFEDNEIKENREGHSNSSLASDIAAAFAAVEHGDILKDDPLTFRHDETAGLSQDVESASEESDQDVTVPKGPPPTMTIGDDDIYWMNQLHVALFDAGFYPGDEDIDDFMFGESTQSAVLTFQACNGLPETGSVDEKTWRELLGEELKHKKSRDLTEDVNPLTDKGARKPEVHLDGGNLESGKTSARTAGKPFAELFSAEVSKVETSDRDSTIVHEETHIHDEKYFPDGHIEVIDERTTSISGRAAWPVLLEGEGGQEVHALHVLLESAGYWPGEDDVQWWQYGDSTVAAVKTFQACNGMTESGTCDETLWKALLGQDATPSTIDSIKSGKSDDEDLSLDGTDNRVWLIGEQRWEDRSKLK